MNFQGSGGVLARVISKAEAKEELQCVYGLSCGDNYISLCRRLRRQCYYSLEVAKEAANIQKDCFKYQNPSM